MVLRELEATGLCGCCDMRMQGYNLEEVLQDCASSIRSCSNQHGKYAQDQAVIDALSFLPLLSLSLLGSEPALYDSAHPE